MPFNGSGTFTPIPAPDFPAVPGTVISSSSYNAMITDLVTNGLTKCITRDGQSPPTADLPMAGHKLTGLAVGAVDTDSAQLGQTLAVRGVLGAVDWNTRNTNGIFEATAASFLAPASNFPPTTNLGQLFVAAQGALVTQIYFVANTLYLRQSVSSVWGTWLTPGGSSGANFFINGGLRVWQSTVLGGTSLASGSGKRYLADMVYQESAGTTYSTTQEVFAPGVDAPGVGAQFFLKSIVTSVAGTSNFHTVNLPIEDVRALAGKQVTVSFWVLGTAAQDLAVVVGQNFGTGGSPSATVETFGGKVSCTTSWSRVSTSFTIPSITGKTIGTSSNSFQVIKIYTDAGSGLNTQTSSLGQQSGTYSFSCFKLELGSVTTGFTYPSQEQELDDCRRYYSAPVTSTVNKAGVQLNWSGATTTSAGYAISVPHPVLMRQAPTVTFVNYSANGFPTTPFALTVSSQISYYELVASSAVATGQFAGFQTLDARM